MSPKKALKRAASDPSLAFAVTFAAAVRARYRVARDRDGDDAGLTSLEYALLAAAILVVVVTLAAAIVGLLNKKIGILNGIN